MFVLRPAPKRKRIVDRKVTEKARARDGVCLYGIFHRGAQHGGCKGGLDGHHIIPVGIGGPDVIENIISLCRWHHTVAEALMITAGELRPILSRYYGYKYDDLGLPIMSDVGNLVETQ